MGINRYYDSKSGTTKYKCSACKDWFLRDEVTITNIDNDLVARDYVEDTDSIVCITCEEEKQNMEERLDYLNTIIELDKRELGIYDIDSVNEVKGIIELLKNMMNGV